MAGTLVLANDTIVPGNYYASTAGIEPGDISYDSVRQEIFVADPASDEVLVISTVTDKIVATVAVGHYPIGLIYHSGANEIFVLNGFSNNISIISDLTSAVVGTITGIATPCGAAYDPVERELFVTNEYSANVTVISDVSNQIVATIGTGQEPCAATYDNRTGTVFVANAGSGNVTELSPVNNSVVANVPVGSHPLGIAFDDHRREIFVTNQGSGTVSVLSDTANSVLYSIPVGGGPNGVAFNPQQNEILVANDYSNNLSVLSDSQDLVIATLAVGSDPLAIAFDSASGVAYLGNYLQCTLSIIAWPPSAFPLTFAESGLPTGASWSVSLSGSPTQTTSEPVITFEVPNGAYGYTVSAADPDYRSTNSTGVIDVNGTGSYTLAVFQLMTYPVVFRETGLPPGTEWWINLSVQPSRSVNSSSISLNLPNGTYSYSGSASGYSSVEGNVKVLGPNVTPVTLSFVPNSAALTKLNPTDYLVIGALAAVLVISIIAILVYRARRSPPKPQK